MDFLKLGLLLGTLLCACAPQAPAAPEPERPTWEIPAFGGTRIEIATVEGHRVWLFWCNRGAAGGLTSEHIPEECPACLAAREVPK